MLESSIVIYENKIVSVDIGSPSCVDFNTKRINNIEKSIKGFEASKLLFYHVHFNYENFSFTDYNCMKGYDIRFDYPIYFSILLFKNDSLADTTHKQLSYRYKDKLVKNTEHIPLKEAHLLILKNLSYGAHYVKEY